ncbi:hypothetical protein E2542_SST26531 [Spatholobus suberectus]|nr:hypothetical protein E2542_SST26531 [Spatholobus suberectus]
MIHILMHYTTKTESRKSRKESTALLIISGFHMKLITEPIHNMSRDPNWRSEEEAYDPFSPVDSGDRDDQRLQDVRVAPLCEALGFYGTRTVTN